MNEPKFAKEDVWAVARAIGDGLYIDEAGRNARLCCAHCHEWVYYTFDEDEAKARKEFVHKEYCVVLKARDLLTGAPAE